MMYKACQRNSASSEQLSNRFYRIRGWHVVNLRAIEILEFPTQTMTSIYDIEINWADRQDVSTADETHIGYVQPEPMPQQPE